jgi:hypothetical protein
MRGTTKRVVVTALVSGLLTVAGVGPLSPASAGPHQDCAALGGQLVNGGGPPRCEQVTSNPNSGHTVVKSYQWSGGSFHLVRTCTYVTSNGNLLESHSDPGCPNRR